MYTGKKCKPGILVVKEKRKIVTRVTGIHQQFLGYSYWFS
jgi:hypothetical protein